MNKSLNTSSVEQNNEDQNYIIDEIEEGRVDNGVFEKSIIEPKMQIPGLDQGKTFFSQKSMIHPCLKRKEILIREVKKISF